jgi:hypothetical protein
MKVTIEVNLRDLVWVRRTDVNHEYAVTMTAEQQAEALKGLADEIVRHAFKQKVGDAASGDQDLASTKAKRESERDKLVIHKWTKERGTAESADPMDVAIRTIVRKMLNEASKLALKNAEDPEAFLMDKYYTAPAEVREDIERRAKLLLGAKAKAEFSL